MAKEQRLDRYAIAAALQEIAALLELKGGKDRFKARAYQTGARVVGGMSEEIGEVVLENRLTSMRGIGDALACLDIARSHRHPVGGVDQRTRRSDQG